MRGEVVSRAPRVVEERLEAAREEVVRERDEVFGAEFEVARQEARELVGRVEELDEDRGGLLVRAPVEATLAAVRASRRRRVAEGDLGGTHVWGVTRTSISSSVCGDRELRRQGETYPRFERPRRELSFLVPLDMSGNALLRVLDTSCRLEREITRKSLDRER